MVAPLYKRSFDFNNNESTLDEFLPKDFNPDDYKVINLHLPGMNSISERIQNQEAENNIYLRSLFGSNTNPYDKNAALRSVASLMKISERMLGGHEIHKADIGGLFISATYKDDMDNTETKGQMVSYADNTESFFSFNTAETMLPFLIKFFVEDAKIKAKFTNNDRGERVYAKVPFTINSSKPLSLDKIYKNLSKLNVLTYSFGGVYSGEICNICKEIYNQLDLPKKEMNALFNNVNVLAIGNHLPVNSNFLFNAVLVEGINDAVVNSNIRNFQGSIPDKYDNKLAILNPTKNILRVIDTIPESTNYWRTDNLEWRVTTEKDWQFHKKRLYMSHRFGKDDTLPTMLENMWRRMVKGEMPENIPDRFKFSESIVGHSIEATHVQSQIERNIDNAYERYNNVSQAVGG